MFPMKLKHNDKNNDKEVKMTSADKIVVSTTSVDMIEFKNLPDFLSPYSVDYVYAPSRFKIPALYFLDSAAVGSQLQVRFNNIHDSSDTFGSRYKDAFVYLDLVNKSIRTVTPPHKPFSNAIYRISPTRFCRFNGQRNTTDTCKEIELWENDLILRTLSIPAKIQKNLGINIFALPQNLDYLAMATSKECWLIDSINNKWVSFYTHGFLDTKTPFKIAVYPDGRLLVYHLLANTIQCKLFFVDACTMHFMQIDEYQIKINQLYDDLELRVSPLDACELLGISKKQGKIELHLFHNQVLQKTMPVCSVEYNPKGWYIPYPEIIWLADGTPGFVMPDKILFVKTSGLREELVLPDLISVSSAHVLATGELVTFCSYSPSFYLQVHQVQYQNLNLKLQDIIYTATKAIPSDLVKIIADYAEIVPSYSLINNQLALNRLDSRPKAFLIQLLEKYKNEIETAKNSFFKFKIDEHLQCHLVLSYFVCLLGLEENSQKTASACLRSLGPLEPVKNLIALKQDLTELFQLVVSSEKNLGEQKVSSSSPTPRLP